MQSFVVVDGSLIFSSILYIVIFVLSLDYNDVVITLVFVKLLFFRMKQKNFIIHKILEQGVVLRSIVQNYANYLHD